MHTKFFNQFVRSPEGDEGTGGGGGGGKEGDEATGDQGKSSQKTGGEAEGEDDAAAELARLRSENAKFKKETEARTKADEKAKADKLKAENKFKELADENEKKALEATQRAERIENSYLTDRKFNAVRTAAEKLGLRVEAVADLEGLDLDDIQVETTSTGKINVLNADKFASRLKTQKPHWFQDPKATKVNSNGQRVVDDSSDTGEMTGSKLLKLEMECRKKGDMAPYQAAFKKFQQQRVAARAK